MALSIDMMYTIIIFYSASGGAPQATAKNLVHSVVLAESTECCEALHNTGSPYNMLPYRGFEWDPVKAATNFREHGIAFADAIDVFDDDRAVIEDDAGP